MTVYRFCNEWATTIAAGGGDGFRRWQSCNVYYSGRTIYSYGSHFPMAYILAPNVVWVNGDRPSRTTTRHQSELRTAIATKAPSATVIIVPQSALEAAGCDYRTIEPVDVHGERWEYSLQSSDTPPADMVANDLIAAGHYGGRYGAYSDTVGYVTRDSSTQLVRYFDGKYHWRTARHWLGDAVFTAIRDRWFNGTVGPRVYFISSFDRQERAPLYFLSQLPGPADTVDQAIESLAPESVKTARDMGRRVVRQGDMFAIPMDVTTRQLKAQGATITRRNVTVTLRRQALESVARRDALQTIMPDMPEYPQRTYWRPGTDRAAYDADCKAWRDACDDWTDDLLARFAERYPDLPAPSRYGWQSDLIYQPGAWDKQRDVTGTALYGTAHTATEVATLPDGRQYARGVMYHEPAIIGEWRASDHRRQKLGKQWHLIARNTVPVSRTGSGRRAA